MSPLLFLLAVLSLLLLRAPATTAEWQYDPSPNPESVVKAGKARFTVLTDRIVRMEWGVQVDAATWGVLNRNLPVPSFQHSVERGILTITTQALKLRYSTSATTTFDSSNLQVSFMLDGYTVTWTPQPATQQAISGNLYGTFRTLDGNNGTNEPLNCYKNSRPDLHCTLGLVSRHGYVVVDETYRPQFTSDPWPWVTTANVSAPSPDMCIIDPADRLACGGNPIDVGQFDCNGRGCCYDAKPASGTPFCYYSKTSYQDLYFFAHGHDYKSALREFTMLSGKIPIPPRYAFGIFYSRYWAYNDIEEMDIVKNYEQRGIPLDVLVTDMDWHVTFYKEAAKGEKDQAGQPIGWTGFTWDPALFPNPKPFLDWCKSYGLKNTLNLHPASGIQPWEEKYPEMATAMGIDYHTHKYVPFAPTNQTFVKNWFQIVLGERETQGIDFWWLDWQQGEDWIKMPGVNPTFWLNYLFFTNPFHWNETAPKLTRPLLLHRWGGLGNHRYQTGFSGDVMPSWTSLQFQVYFTVAATNVGFGYWSHDIGGHLEPCPPELYTRWIQWGAFSPMFRTHCTKNADNFRRIWMYPPAYYPIMRSFMRLREALVPYIYTQARTAHDTGLSLIRGMYYEYPEDTEAYSYQDSQYFFGDKLLVAPVTSPSDNSTGLTSMDIWIPVGTFVASYSGEVVKGPQVIHRSFALYEMPVFAKAGAIVPLRTDDFEPIGSAQQIPTSLKLMTFIGGIATSGSGSLYEDDGHTIAYQDGSFTTQQFSYSIKDAQLTFTITATTMPVVLTVSTRLYQVCLRGYLPATTVQIDGVSARYTPLKGPVYPSNTWTYDGSLLMLIITTDTLDLSKDHMVTVTTAKSPISPILQTNYAGLLQRFLNAKQLLDGQWGINTVYQEDYHDLLLATETGVKISYENDMLETYLDQFGRYTQTAISEVQNITTLSEDVKKHVLALLQNK